MEKRWLRRCKTFLKYLFISLLCLVGARYSFIATPAQDRGGFHSLTLSHGLSDLLVNKIFKDTEGFIWFGTESSVDRFDGNQIMRFPIPGNKQKSRRVLCFAEMPDHNIYIGTNQGLFEINNREKILRSVLPDKLNFAITGLSSGENNQLFIGSGSGFYIYNQKSGKIQHKFLDDDILSERNEVKGLWYQGNSILWILTPHRLWEMNLEKNQTVAYPLPVNSVSTRLCDIHNTIYIGTDGSGVLPFEISQHQYHPAIHVGNNIVTTLSATPDGELLIGTDGEGICVYSVEKGKTVDHLTSSAGSKLQLRSNSVYSALKDDKGILWVGYYQSGVDYTPVREYEPEVIELPDVVEMSQQVVRSFEKKDQYVVIGTHEGVIFINEDTGQIHKYSTPEIASNLILSIEYWRGDFYIGTFHGGIYRLNPKTAKISRYGPRSIYDQSVFSLEVDPQDELWAATSDGLYEFNDEFGRPSVALNSKNSQLPPGNVYNIYFDSLDRGWISTENGLAIWNGQYVNSTGFPSDFINKMKIRVVFEDKNHNLYFAPDRGVIWTSDLSLQNVMALEESDDERFTQITAIIEDRDGWIWIGTDKGLFSINKNYPENFKVFNYAGGVINPVYTLARPYEDEKGDLWFGSTTGLHKIDYQKMKEERLSGSYSPLIISDIESGGKSLPNLEQISPDEYSLLLKKDQKDLVIYVTDLKYEPRDLFEVEYKIEKKSIKNEWKWANGSDPIRFRELPEGDFTINIKLAGIPDSQINLKVKWQKTFPWWWIAGGSFLVIIGVMIFLYYRNNRKVRKIEENTPPSSESTLSANEEITDQNNAEERLSYRTTRLSDEECKRLLKKLNNLMKADKPFKNPDLKIKDLAEMVGTNAHSLSFIFNQYLKKSYYDYVNEWRVEEFKNLVKVVDVSKYTLSGMAEKCGFSSRASFFRHFKNLTGMTPAEYLKKVSKNYET